MADISDIVFCHAYILEFILILAIEFPCTFGRSSEADALLPVPFSHEAGSHKTRSISLRRSPCFFSSFRKYLCVYIPQNNLIFPKRKKKKAGYLKAALTQMFKQLCDKGVRVAGVSCVHPRKGRRFHLTGMLSKYRS